MRFVRHRLMQAGMASLCAALLCATAPGLAEQKAPKPAAKPKPAPRSQKGADAMPICRQVGGYEAYMKRTGKVCKLTGEEFNDPNYHGRR